MTGRAGVIAVAVLGCAVIAIGVVAKRCSGESSRGGAQLAEVPDGSRAGSGTRRRATATAEKATRTLAGTVYLDGKPVIADVMVADDFGAVSRVKSDARGRFEAPARTAVYRLLASAPGAVPQAIAIDLATDSRDVEIFLRGCAIALEGDVRDASGGGIAGATILSEGLTIATADAKGRYELCFAAADTEIDLTARADGYGDARRKYVAGLNALDFDLVPEAIIAGRVVDRGGKPVPDALVELRPWEDGTKLELHEMVMAKSGVTLEPKLPRLAIVTRARTGDDGRFELRRLPSRTYLVLARTDVLATAGAGERVVAAAGRSDDLMIVVDGAVRVHGTVLDSRTEKPRGGVPLFWSADGIDHARTASADDGTFELLGVPLGSGILGTNAPSYVEVGPTVAKLGDGPRTIYFTPSTKISGHVLRDGHAVGGATVTLGSLETRSRADGSYELIVITGGKMSVTASDGIAFDTIEVVGVEGKDVEHADIELKFSASIAGVVVDQTGAPVVGANVELQYGNDAGQSLTRKDGRFSATMLRGGGPYTLEVRYEGAPLTAAAGGAWPAITVAGGNTHVENVHLQAKLVRRTIGGRVVDPQGKPASDALVTMFPGERTTHTATDGTFSFATAHAGPFAFEAKSSGLRQGRASSVPLGGSAEIVMRDPGRIDIRCEPKLRGVRIVRGFTTLAGACDTIVGPLVPGNYVVTGETGDVRIELEAGTTAIVRLAPLPLGTVEVSVPDAPAGTSCGAPTSDGFSQRVAVAGGVATIQAWYGDRVINCYADRSRGSARVTVGSQPVKVTINLKPAE